MRGLLIFGAACSLGFLFWRLSHVHVPIIQHLYVGYVLLCTLASPLVLRWFETHKKDYTLFFLGTMVPAAFMAMWMAGNWFSTVGFDDGAAFIAGLLVCGLALLFIVRGHSPKHLAVDTLLLQGFFFLASGVLTFVSLVPPSTELDVRLKYAYGAYWTAIGVWSFVSCIWIARSQALFHSTNDWLPMVACIAFALALSVALQRQAELGRQHSEDEQPVELAWEQP